MQSFKKFYESFTSFQTKEGAISKIQCVARWGACDIGKVYTGVWKQAARSHQLRFEIQGLPGATAHPIIFFDKERGTLDMPKQFKIVDQ